MRKEGGNMKISANILIIEDDKEVRDLLFEFLSKLGYKIKKAGTGKEGLKKIQSNKIDVVILDILLPDMNGIDLLPQIKSLNDESSIIMLTGISDLRTVRKAIQNGAYDYIVKPIEFDDLQISIGRAVEKTRLLRIQKDYNKYLEKTVEKQKEQIRKTFVGAIISLVKLLEARDIYQKGHSLRVGSIAGRMGKLLGFSKKRIENIRIAGFLHDVGKVIVPEEILFKPAKLNGSELLKVRKHPGEGAEILKYVIEDNETLQGIKHHHECYNGKGYPDKLKGEEIPIFGRIIAIADALDAMLSDRPYRATLTIEDVKREFTENKGTQFDPKLVDLLLEKFDDFIQGYYE